MIFNAFIHGKTDKVTIKIDSNKGLCYISVIDWGVGIPDEHKDKIFDESFFYGETGQTGLGLYIVKQKIDRYGGVISVEDNKPNGTIFRFTLNRIK